MNSVRTLESPAITNAIKTFERHGGILRTSELLAAGTHESTLYQMRDEGLVELLARGVYRLTAKEALGQPDLVIVAKKIPKAVICLVSALNFHEITTHFAYAVQIMLPRGTRRPVLDFPPIQVHSAVPNAYEAGQETHRIEGVAVRVTDVEKTLIDCFKFRNQLGMDPVLEALHLYRERKRLNVNALMRYARICRVEKVVTPYLEAVV
jgi:predicted transcriptional regulator of viral defense system